MGCVVCAMLGKTTGLRIEYHHFKEGVQLGHRFGVALCLYHHRGVLPKGYTQALARAEFGPSVISSAAFHRRFGDDQALLNFQDDAVGYARATIERVRHNPERSRGLPGRKHFPREGLA